MKKIITCIISCILFIVCIPFTATAKVIEPEVVKTEKWTASYFIDDGSDTLYPYVECQANIYNDGTLDVIYCNTHDWDGFSTVSHYIVFPYTLPFEFNCERYNNVKSILEVGKYKESDPHSDSSYVLNRCYISDFTLNEKLFDLSYYPKEYSQTVSSSFANYITDTDRWGTYQMDGFHSYDVTCELDSYYQGKKSTGFGSYTKVYISTTYHCALCDLPTKEKRMWHIKFTPKVDPTETYNFRLFGHDITITPEILSGNIVSEPVLTEQEQYIKQLEEENKKLKEQLNNPYTGYITVEQNNGTAAERFPVTVYSDGRTETTEEFQNYINSLNVKIEQLMNRINLVSNGSCGDIDGDGNISVEDAQLLLQYYTESKVAQLTDDPIDVWYFVKFGKG